MNEKSKIPVVYIIGPFRAASSWGVEQNIRRAEEVALWVWSLGAAAICPHTNTRFYQGALPDEVWLEGDLAILRKCDAVLACDGWMSSEGSRKEVEEAESLGIPVFYHETMSATFSCWVYENSSGHKVNVI
jgi:hypothetical protein